MPRNSSSRAVRPPVRLQIGHRVGDLVEFGDGLAGLQEPLGVGHGLQLLVGRRHVLAPIPAADLAVAVADLGGEKAGMVVVQLRREHALGEGVDLWGEVPGDVVVPETLAHHRGVLALDQRVVVGSAGARLREVGDVQLVEQPGHLVVDVLGTVVRVEAEDDERQRDEHLLQHRRQERLGDRDHRADMLELGHLVDQVDVVDALLAVAVSLVHRVHPPGSGRRLSPIGTAVGLVWFTVVRRAR